MKNILIALSFITIVTTAAYADFQEGYPPANAPVTSGQLRENLDQLWVASQQLTQNGFLPAIGYKTIIYTGGKVCSGNNIYTVADGTLDFSTYSVGSTLYVSVIVSGGAASLSVDTGAYNSAGIKLWTVSIGASGPTITSDDRTWVQKSIGTALSAKTSGILESSSGFIGVATPGKDYLTPTGDGSKLTGITTQQVGLGTVNGIMKANGSGTVSAAVAGADYQAPLTFSQSVVNSSGAVALSGDAATPGNNLYYGTNGSGNKGYYALSNGLTGLPAGPWQFNQHTLPANTYWSAIAWNGTVFCAVAGSYGGTTNIAATSPDGITWTQRTMPATATWNAIAWNGSVFCALAGYSGNNIAATSPDGITWTQRTLPATAQWSSIAWNGTVFCAAASGIAATSPDGITWTQRTMPATTQWSSIAWNGTVFCAVGNGSTAATSPDGITWTQRTMPANQQWSSIAWNGMVFCAVGSYGGNIAATSPDGITWTQRILPASTYWDAIAWNGTVFCAVGGTGGAINTAATSPDGITWTQRTMPVSAYWQAIAAGGSTFCAVAFENSSGSVTNITATGGFFNYQTAVLAADVSMTTINTYYDGPSITLGQGTWLVDGKVTCYNLSTPNTYIAKLWDGTTVYASTQVGNNYAGSLALQWIVYVASSSTIKISCAAGGSGCYIKATCPFNNGAVSNASTLTAIRISN